MNDSSHMSNDSSEGEPNSDTLDELYKDHLQNVRELIIKQNNSNDIELCRKWLKAFSNTAKCEKLARNCLCTLMQHQLHEFGYLGAPFTDVQNCNRNLELVLRDLDQPEASCNIEESETLDTFTSHHRFNMGLETMYEEPAQGSDYITEMTCLENETQTDNVMLRRELEMLRLQLTEKQIENAELKEIVEKCELEDSVYVDTFASIKQMLLDSIKATLMEMGSDEKHFPANMFELIFRDFANDEEFLGIIKAYDGIFQRILNKFFQQELNKRKSLIARHVCRDLGKSKAKLRKRYEKRLKLQCWAQKLQLKLVKLKCFTALRQLFMNMEHSADENMWNLLKALEEKYQAIVDEIA